jgi:hypothetical protein
VEFLFLSLLIYIPIYVTPTCSFSIEFIVEVSSTIDASIFQFVVLILIHRVEVEHDKRIIK